MPPGAKKAGLIAKILAEPAAVDVYNALYNPTEVTLQHDASSQSKPNASGKSPVQVRRIVVRHYLTTLC